MLRTTPYIDKSHIQTLQTTPDYTVIDAFSGAGGVGKALSEQPISLPADEYAGLDITDYSHTYPGEFVQIDLLSDKPFSAFMTSGTHPRYTARVAWCSFPCTAYSTLTRLNYSDADNPTQAALDDNPRITDELRAALLQIAPQYVIENVPRATAVGDLQANARLNGLAFDLSIDMERHFETTFSCPSAYTDGNPDVAISTRGDQSIAELAAVKDVPTSWGKQSVRSALPRQYVRHVLSNCPTLNLQSPAVNGKVTTP